MNCKIEKKTMPLFFQYIILYWFDFIQVLPSSLYDYYTSSSPREHKNGDPES